MKISDAMSSPAVAVPTRTPLGEVARQNEYGVGCVVVTEGGTLRGIVTDRGLAVRALARGLDPDERVDTVNCRTSTGHSREVPHSSSVTSTANPVAVLKQHGRASVCRQAT